MLSFSVCYFSGPCCLLLSRTFGGWQSAIRC